MEQYILQLTEDLNKAAQTKLQAPDYTLLYPDHPAIEYGLDYIVEWECAPDERMADVFGISNEAFPPMEMLNEAQAEKLNQAILALWRANDIYADFPEKLPSQLILYRELRKKWLEGSIRIMSEQTMTTIEFCSYNAETCPWGVDFCTCKDAEWYQSDTDIENFTPPQNGELLF